MPEIWVFPLYNLEFIVGQQQATESAVIAYSGYVTKGGGVTAVGAGLSQKMAETSEFLTFADIGVVVGIAGVLIGLMVNLVAHWRRDRREQELHRLKAELIKNGCLEDFL